MGRHGGRTEKGMGGDERREENTREDLVPRNVDKKAITKQDKKLFITQSPSTPDVFTSSPRSLLKQENQFLLFKPLMESPLTS